VHEPDVETTQEIDGFIRQLRGTGGKYNPVQSGTAKSVPDPRSVFRRCEAAVIDGSKKDAISAKIVNAGLDFAPLWIRFGKRTMNRDTNENGEETAMAVILNLILDDARSAATRPGRANNDDGGSLGTRG
jgi:hypothetical protein